MIPDTPIIESLLDLDAYKIRMGQFVFHRYREAPVKYRFTNRTTAVRLADMIPIEVLRKHLNHITTLTFSADEIAYLKTLSVADDYIKYLKTLRLPELCIDQHDGQFIIETETDSWSQLILWETLVLSTVSELYTHYLAKDRRTNLIRLITHTGIERLGKKIAALRSLTNTGIIDFGTRRRAVRFWQKRVLHHLANRLPSHLFDGTSNLFFAKELGIPVKGTMAHELFMVLSCLTDTDHGIRGTHFRVLDEWYDEYGLDLSIALSDTFGTRAFFEDFETDLTLSYNGTRHDSGCPYEYGAKTIRHYEHYEVDPMEKSIVFSDGLDIDSIIALHRYFDGRINTSFGWGTTLTNDIGLPTISIVMKAIGAFGRSTVKLSDNLAKAIGEPERIERFKKIFGYTNTSLQMCVV